MPKNQPPLLVVWGKHDLSFDPGEPERDRKDVPNAAIHVLDAGHFRTRYQSGRNCTDRAPLRHQRGLGKIAIRTLPDSFGLRFLDPL